MAPAPVPTTAEVQAAFPSAKILQVLGSGGQAAVFRAEFPAYGQCALKVYAPTADPIRAELEAAKLKRIKSSHVVTCHEFGTAEVSGTARLYCCTSYVEGTPLRSPTGSLLGHMQEGDITTLLLDLAAGVDALWSEKVVHRDLKPENVMWNTAGRAVVIDLGFARHLDEASLTAPYTTYGTLGYMSPEQASARRNLTYKSDLYTVGLIAFEAACGYHPFARNQALINSSISAPPLGSKAKIADGARHLVTRLLDRNPLKRPTFAEIKAAL